MSLIRWQRVEGGLIFASSLVALLVGFGVDNSIVWLLVFFAPDLSFAAYALGPRIGAAVYNLVHIYAMGPLIALVGGLFAGPHWLGVGLMVFGHAGFDRMLGYGLKAETGFKDTHLGRL